MVSTEVERASDVDPADVPSAQWGWSKINYRSWYIAGWAAVLFLLAMIHGNHHGRVEDIFLIVFAAAGAFFLIRDMWGRRRGWLR